MKADKWQQLDKIFDLALEQAPHDRAAFLDEACTGDNELRRKLDALLVAHENAGSFLERPALQIEAEALAAEQLQTNPSSAEGRMIGHYRISRRLGAGGMGEVYLAQDLSLDRQVALKLLPKHFTTDGERLRRFEQEARASSGLNHPNILTVYEIGKVDSLHYIASQFVEGMNLREYMKSRPLNLGEALAVAMQIASALAAAHARGIVHRDIKPENIMVSSVRHLGQTENHVTVVDFGIAKLIQTDVLETDMSTRPLLSTEAGKAVGTVPYMSPEQAQGIKVDARTDIWSLGVMLYEMVSGRLPFEGETPNHVVVSILEREPPSIGEIVDVPEELESIVSQALRKNRDERYHTVSQFYGDLQDLRDTLTNENFSRNKVDSNSTRRFVRKGALPHSDNVPWWRNTEQLRESRWASGVLISAMIVALVGIAFIVRHFIWPSANQPKLPFTNFAMKPLTTDGKARSAVISPDGVYVIHVTGSAQRQSLQLRHIATNSDREIVPSNGSPIRHLSFSPDSNHIFFVRTEEGESVLDEVGLLGTPPKRVVRRIDTAATFSPDGKHFAFVRGDPSEGEASLIVANADGSDEQKLVTHRWDDFYFSGLVGTPAWSRDGNRIAISLRGSGAAEKYRNLTTVELQNGQEKQITTEKWNTIQSISWLPRDQGLLITAIDPERQHTQLFYVAYPSGEVRQLTTEINNYGDISVAADGRTAVTVRSEAIADVWVTSVADSSRSSQITFNKFDGVGGVDWTADNKIVHVSNVSGNRDIWIVNEDGSNDTQLTADAGLNIQTSVSPDGRYIVFQSDRTGSFNVWRMELDGSNQKRLTQGHWDVDPRATRDNQVIYSSIANGRRSVWKVGIDGGNPMQLLDYVSSTESASPNDEKIAVTFVDHQVTPPRERVGVFATNGGPSIKEFDLPLFWETIGCGFYGQQIRWTADGKELSYVEIKDDVANIWAQPLDGGPKRQLTKFSSGLIFFYALSRDGKKFALSRGSKISDVVLIKDTSQ